MSENTGAEVFTLKQTQSVDIEKTAVEASDVSRPGSSQEETTLVDWNGLDDPEMPGNWRPRKKWTNLLLVSGLTLLTPFASSMFAPAISEVMTELGTTDRNLASFMVSVYLLGYAFGPLIIAPLSELYGRLPLYYSTTVLFVLGNIACGFSTSMPMLIGFRLLTGCFGAAPLTIGPGTVGDCFKQAERGRAMAVWTMPVLLGPCLGPAIGAYISRALGWRWSFYILCIVTAAFLLCCISLLHETHAPTLLRKRTKQLIKTTGNTSLRSAQASTKTHRQLFMQSISRPLKMLCLSPIILGLSLLTAVAYGTLYLLFTTMADVFVSTYGFVDNVGLVYLGPGVGQFIGLFVFGAVSDRILVHMAKGGDTKPEYRLVPMLPGAAMIPIGLLIYGWSAHYQIHWIVPIIGLAFVGFGMISVFSPVGTYLVDAFPVYAASATAANTVFRSIGGALLPLAGASMYETLGQGWGNTLLAGISLGLMGMIVLAGRYGETFRTHPKYQVNL